MKRMLCVAALAATPMTATADPVDVSGCEPQYRDSAAYLAMRCEVTNTSATPVAEIVVRFLYVDPARTVPWAEDGDTSFPIAGGIEPNETTTLTLIGPAMPDRANRDAVEIRVTISEARDVEGRPID